MLGKIWQWWRGSRRFELYLDAFSLDRQTRETSLISAAKSRLELDQTVVVLAHFPTTFFRLQDLLQEAAIPYTIGGPTLRATDIQDYHDKQRQSVWLMLADAIQDVEERRIAAPAYPVEINVLIAERYPLPARDEVVDRFFRQLPFSVRVGYLLSLEDPLVRAAVNETLIRLMQQMGFKPGEMISSHLLSRSILHWGKKVSCQISQEIIADSPEEWLEKNFDSKLTPKSHD